MSSPEDYVASLSPAARAELGELAAGDRAAFAARLKEAGFGVLASIRIMNAARAAIGAKGDVRQAGGEGFWSVTWLWIKAVVLNLRPQQI